MKKLSDLILSVWDHTISPILGLLVLLILLCFVSFLLKNLFLTSYLFILFLILISYFSTIFLILSVMLNKCAKIQIKHDYFQRTIYAHYVIHTHALSEVFYLVEFFVNQCTTQVTSQPVIFQICGLQCQDFCLKNWDLFFQCQNEKYDLLRVFQFFLLMCRSFFNI